ncbi:MAG: ribonuclease HI [Clostridiales bacterium]|nr:ribonuclease HI [Clostridiales bacterium]
MKEVLIYTDGACSGNPGSGGYCAILNYQGVEKVISGGEKLTTNNRMELLAVINGVKALKEPCIVKIVSDSQYVVSAFNNGWIYSWQLNGWKTANKKEVKNVDLWEELISLTKIHQIEFVKTLGHADDELNNRCDKIAREESKKF